jgi:hypothetical protein
MFCARAWYIAVRYMSALFDLSIHRPFSLSTMLSNRFITIIALNSFFGWLYVLLTSVVWLSVTYGPQCYPIDLSPSSHRSRSFFGWLSVLRERRGRRGRHHHRFDRIFSLAGYLFCYTLTGYLFCYSLAGYLFCYSLAGYQFCSRVWYGCPLHMSRLQYCPVYFQLIYNTIQLKSVRFILIAFCLWLAICSAHECGMVVRYICPVYSVVSVCFPSVSSLSTILSS